MSSEINNKFIFANKDYFSTQEQTSRLQPIDAGIIQSFKIKYRRRLVNYVLARINEYSSATQIIKDVNILIAIRLAQETWKELTGVTINNFLRSVGLSKMMI